MKRLMKLTSTLLGLAALVASTTVMAQSHPSAYPDRWEGVTMVANQLVTSNSTATLTVAPVPILMSGPAIKFETLASAADVGVSNLVTTYKVSLDAVSWPYSFNITNVLNGTNVVDLVTGTAELNVTNYTGYRWIKPTSIQTWQTNDVTVTLKLGYFY